MSPCAYDMVTAKAVAIKLLESDPPTAFICGNDIIAHGVIYAATRLGFNVPREISVVGIGDFRGSSAIEPPLTTVRLPARRIGELAAEALIDKISLRDVTLPPDQILPTELMQRESTACACR